MNNLEERIIQLEKELAKAKIIEQMSRGLNQAKDEVGLLQVFAQPAIENDAVGVILFYIDTDAQGQPEWAEAMVVWKRPDAPRRLSTKNECICPIFL